MLKPLVSILIPAYNAEEWIAHTLRSAISQTWERKEIIVIDDGSSDHTCDVARQFESNGVRIVTQENQGAAAARNKAFSLCRGDYIQWLDADDLLAADKIAQQMEILQQCGSSRRLVSGAWGRFLYRPYRARFVPSALWCDLLPVEWLIRKMGQNLFMQTAAWLVSRELTEKAGPWDKSLVGDDDGEYFCRVLLESDYIRFVSKARVYYRASGVTSLSYIGTSDRKMQAQLRSMQLHVGYLRSMEDSERVHIACLKYLQDWVSVFYPQRLDLVAQLHGMAKELGGNVGVPRLSWKYSWIRSLCGASLASRAQLFCPRIRWSIQSSLDKMLLRIENRDLAQ